MNNKVALIAAALALALSLPAFADKPSKSTQNIAKPRPSKGASTGTSLTSASKGLGNFRGTVNSGGTANGSMIGAVEMAMLKQAKSNNADAKKEAQAAQGGTHGLKKGRGDLTAIPPQK